MILPLWFLVVSLFLPRIALFCGWIHGWAFYMPGLCAGILWLFIPRLLVLLLIATVMGLCPWFWIHLGVAALAWMLDYYQQAHSKERNA